MNKRKLLFILPLIMFSNIISVKAEETYKITGNGVRLRKTAEVSNSNIIRELHMNFEVELLDKEKVTGNGCSKGWYKIKYENDEGYVCSSYVSDGGEETEIEETADPYNRPWNTPGKAILGGAQFISKAYISQGQNTSYLKKFNVNPKSSYSLYNHQYMANLAAPYSEAYTSYKSYSANGLLELPLEFTIPVFNDMPDYTALPDGEPDKECLSEVKDEEFEKILDEQKFPESYKCKLRLLHEKHPNWTFKSLITDLDFNGSVSREQKVSSIQGGSKYYYIDSKGKNVQTEKGWYKANTQTVEFYLDPRNFLVEERILMFENLSYSENYTEEVLTSILKSTFMSGISILDNMSYAKIFVEAGKNANVSAVYLASLAIQESGSKGSRATTGAEFTYNDITYKGLYNFFNIGAYSSESSPILAGLVWASAGIDVENSNEISNEKKEETPEIVDGTKVTSYLDVLNLKAKSNCLTTIEEGTKASFFKVDYKGDIIITNPDGKTIGDNDTVVTGTTITVKNDSKEYSYTVSISGDVNGDGKVTAADYTLIKNNIMGKSGSEFNVAQGYAADKDNNGKIGATDYVVIKNIIMK